MLSICSSIRLQVLRDKKRADLLSQPNSLKEYSMSKSLSMLAQLKQLVKRNYHPNGAILWQHPTKPQYQVIVIEERQKLSLRYTSPTAYRESQPLMSFQGSGSFGSMLTTTGGRGKGGYSVLPTTTARYHNFCNQIRSTL